MTCEYSDKNSKLLLNLACITGPREAFARSPALHSRAEEHTYKAAVVFAQITASHFPMVLLH